MNDTIVAPASAYGLGAISIVRLSGELSYELGLRLSKKKILKPRFATFTRLFKDNDDFIDEAILIYFKAPYSFTGEDILEFQIHGGVTSSQILINEILKHGIRLANPGEFSKRAVLN